MKFKQFLTEIEHYPNIEYDDWIDSIKTECSEFLEINKGALLQEKYLFRGMSDRVPSYFSGIPRKDRRPLDTNGHIHIALDDYFFKKFGFRYRSNGLFVCRTYEIARQYSGSTHNTSMIFPTNGYTMCSSYEIRDMYKDLRPYKLSQRDFDDIGKTSEDIINCVKRIENGTETDFKLFNEMMDSFEYFENKTLEKHRWIPEIMVQCDKFYGYPFIGDGMAKSIIKALFNPKEQK